MSIEEAQKEVDYWIKTYGVRYFSELTNMAVLTEEVGELARVMARKYGDQSFKAGEKENISEEIADIFWVLLCIANQTGVDLTQAFEQSIAKKTMRDNTRHINNPKLQEHGA
ncbi:MAG: nucleotide pyrophosphohydrolase [Bacteroidaceae bacterium]|nr:nucleotide pyrophosphohydrolase [Bacteroidaceae bacterium]